ncbi:MAG: DUF2157 domain-containing protein [Opitutus sp.]|nr:DUF2157 domain-containing protein [Opitutus sp.]
MSFESRLRKESPRWVAAGVISPEQAERLRALHPEADGAAASRFLTIISLLGAVLCVVGLALIISANWQAIHRWVKIGGLVVLLAGAHAGGYWLKFQRADFPKLGEAFIMAGCVLFLLGIALVSQIFHLGGRAGNAVLVWAAGIAAIPFLTRARGGVFRAAGRRLLVAGGRVDRPRRLAAPHRQLRLLRRFQPAIRPPGRIADALLGGVYLDRSVAGFRPDAAGRAGGGGLRNRLRRGVCAQVVVESPRDNAARTRAGAPRGGGAGRCGRGVAQMRGMAAAFAVAREPCDRVHRPEPVHALLRHLQLDAEPGADVPRERSHRARARLVPRTQTPRPARRHPPRRCDMNRARWLALVGGLQVALLVGWVGYHEWNRTTAPTILLETVPVDPRDLLRGDYMILSYKISRVPAPPTGGDAGTRGREI